ncbi:hypothetical protein QTP70_015651 [Hemibagrus guttatus]|uniref:Reverse transcriptase n=1 Tax=Hemibagrus guttatus TaxID=175788 RepID=A0AAE0Q2I1_9TELE|nr:hypothetical protein QTP70_015651 [Hemibagrus guttatus]KAK3536591.1 hypothetical protein QTP86_013789 [Hemibagrus guttatus]
MGARVGEAILKFNKTSLELEAKAAGNSASGANSAHSSNSVNGSMHIESVRVGNAFMIWEHDMRKAFRRTDTMKAAGPDGISGRVLRDCTDQLAPVFTEIFNLSWEQSVTPTCLKQTIIVPVPNKLQPAFLNDHHPVALTSVVMKYFGQRLHHLFIT